jgi:hypothetical protein
MPNLSFFYLNQSPDCIWHLIMNAKECENNNNVAFNSKKFKTFMFFKYNSRMPMSNFLREERINDSNS